MGLSNRSYPTGLISQPENSARPVLCSQESTHSLLKRVNSRKAAVERANTKLNMCKMLITTQLPTNANPACTS